LIIYQASKSQFLHHAFREDIEDVVSVHFRSATGHGVGPSEIQSWKYSLLEMAKVLQDEEIPGDAGLAIEYQLPQSAFVRRTCAMRTRYVGVKLRLTRSYETAPRLRTSCIRRRIRCPASVCAPRPRRRGKRT
jgi:hypothetical protein